MKLWEALKTMEENESAKFTNELNTICSKNGEYFLIQFSTKHSTSISYDNWQPVPPEPKKVDFMEAVKAKNLGKIIKSVFRGDEFVYLGGTGKFVDKDGFNLYSQEVEDADWYILD